MEPDPDDARLRCFIVEDSPVIRQNLHATLQELLGVEVVGYAEDEASAVSWMRDGHQPRCDMFIIDIFLRSGTGLEVLRHASQHHPETRRVVLSNYATSDMRQRCLQLGADRVFDKSTELDDLLDYCERLGRRAPEHAHANANGGANTASRKG